MISAFWWGVILTASVISAAILIHIITFDTEKEWIMSVELLIVLLICQEHPWLQSWDELTIMFKILHDEEINRLKKLKANGYKLISSMGI